MTTQKGGLESKHSRSKLHFPIRFVCFWPYHKCEPLTNNDIKPKPCITKIKRQLIETYE